MSIKRFSTRLITLAAALAAGGSLAACGDDSTPKGAVDARRADASPPDGPTFDAAPVATVSSTIAITDVALVDPISLLPPSAQCPTCPGGIGGGSILMSFSDLTDAGGGTVVGTGTTNVNGCIVVKYDPTHPPHAQLDGGPITITNSPANESPATGLLKTVGPCTLIPALGGYTCISHASTTGEAVTATTTGVPAGTVAYVFSTPFTGQNLIGSYLSVNGFTTHTEFNSGTGAFPILGMANGNTTLIALNPAGNATGMSEVGTTILDTILNGFNPVPDQGAGDNGPANFLGTGKIEVKKDANTVWPAIDQIVDVPGEGWTLADESLLYKFPLTTAPTNGVTYGCGSSNTCGDGSTNLIQAMIVSGRATKQSVASLPPFLMPTDVPGVDTWEEFQCAFIGAQDATLTKDAIQQIIDFQPTRVETRVINAAGAIIMTGPGNLNTLNLLVGHGYVGHTDPP